MTYFVLGLAGVVFIGAILFVLREGQLQDDRNETRFKRIFDRQEMLEEMIAKCEKDKDKEKARIDAINKFTGELSRDLDKLSLRADDIAEENRKLSREQEFMKAHQHGMDKRIAGLKREVIVTINEPVKVTGPKTKKPTVTKSLLKRAGVTQ